MLWCTSRYLEKQPAQKWRKAELKEWLDSKGELLSVVLNLMLNLYITGIPYPEDALKKDLWEIIKKSKTPPKYAIDEIAKEKGK